MNEASSLLAECRYGRSSADSCMADCIFCTASSVARCAARPKLRLNSLNSAWPEPVTDFFVTSLPLGSVIVHSSVTLKSVGGQVSRLCDDDVVIIGGVTM